MNQLVDRRKLLAAAAASPLLGLAAGAHANELDVPGAQATGYFTVPTRRVMVSILLPIPPKRIPPRLQPLIHLVLFDVFGNILMKAPIHSSSSFWDLELDPETEVLVARDRDGDRTFQAVCPGGMVNGVLLPAVQRTRALATAQILGEDDSPLRILPFAEQSSNPGPADGAGVGPFLLARGQSARIVLLLPAVQKVREAAARLEILNSSLGRIASVPVEPSDPNKPRSLYVSLERIGDDAGSTGVKVLMGDGSVRFVGAGPTADGVLIALLLPAVQKGGFPTPLGGSVLTPHTVQAMGPVFGLGILL